MKSPLLILLLVPLLSLSSCSKQKEQTADVIVIHSGRMRGNVYPLSLGNISPLQHYQFLAGYVASVRAEAQKTGARVFVVDLGDSLGGSFASHVTSSQNMVTFFNEVGYDGILLSNLDANVPASALAALRAKVLSPFQPIPPNSQFPFPSQATFATGHSTILLQANFYGDTDPSKYPERFPESFGGIPVAPVRTILAPEPGISSPSGKALSLFSWMKFEPTDTPPDSFLKSLRDVGVDAILAHRIYGKGEQEAWTSSGFLAWRPPVSLNILRNNGGFALARLDLARDGQGWKVLRHNLVPMTSNSAPANPAIVASEEAFARQIAEADAALVELTEGRDEDAILAAYMAALQTIPNTQAVAVSRQSIRSDWPAGTLRASRVFNSLPWTTGLVQVTVQQKDIPTLTSFCLIAVSPDANPDGITTTTSRFFGNLIAQKLHLPPSAVVPLSETSEFDFFLNALKSNPQSVHSTLPADWTLYPQQKGAL